MKRGFIKNSISLKVITGGPNKNKEAGRDFYLAPESKTQQNIVPCNIIYLDQRRTSSSGYLGEFPKSQLHEAERTLGSGYSELCNVYMKELTLKL